jgi:hypothetical protein
LVPSFDGGDDFVWVCGPCEALWVIVGLIQETADGGLEVADGMARLVSRSVKQLAERADDQG